MESQSLAWRLLWIGSAGFFALGFFTVWLGPNSASNLEARLERAAEAALESANLTSWSVHARGGALVLEGVAATEDDKRAVVATLKAATGNGEVKSDKVILAPPADPFVWTARKENGFVTLEGVAPSRQALLAIHEAARRLHPSSMTDMTTLASGAPEGFDWGRAAVHGLEALVKLERGTARLAGDELVVSGIAATDAEAEEVTIWVMHAEGGVKPKSEVLGPPEWVASAERGRISLQGKVASTGAGRALARAAANGGNVVDDRSYVAAVGAWQGRALKALPALAQFERGELAVQGRKFRISGEAPGSVLAYLREDMAGIRDGYSVEYNVTETKPDMPELAGLDLSRTGRAKQDACQSAFTRLASTSRIVFAAGRAEIARASGRSLDRLVAVARACAGVAIEIQGHTDASGRRASNLALSRQRAESVKNYLVGQGLSADRLTAVGFGPDRPAASNQTESGRARNRRIEFRVLRGEAR